MQSASFYFKMLCLAVYELPPLPSVQASDSTLVTRIGVVAADVASGLVLVGEFPDDEVRQGRRSCKSEEDLHVQRT
jgi:hypothetical protein